MTPPSTNEPKKVPLRIRLPFASEAEFIARYGLHVTRNTIFITTRAPKPVDTPLTFELVLSDTTRLMRGEGVVLRSEPGAAGRGGMLVRLTRVDPRTKELIDRILALRTPQGASAPPRPPPPEALEAPPGLPRWLTEPPPTTASPPAGAAPPPREGWSPLPPFTSPAPGVDTLSPVPSGSSESGVTCRPSPSAEGHAARGGGPQEDVSAVQGTPTAPGEADRRSGDRAHGPPVSEGAESVDSPPLARPGPSARLQSALDQASSLAPPPARRAVEEEPVLGIALGPLHWRAALVREGRVRLVPLGCEQGATALPAVVAALPDSRWAVGSAAREAPVGHTAAGLERLLGLRVRTPRAERLGHVGAAGMLADADGDAALELGGVAHSARALAAELLRTLKGAAETVLGQPIGRAVLSVPSWYSAHQRWALERAAEVAGLEVLALLNHPSAVATAFGSGRGLARKRMLVFDWEGGPCAVSVVEMTGEDVEVVGAGSDEGLEAPPPGEDVDAWYAARAVRLTRGVLEQAGLSPQSLDELLVSGAPLGGQAVQAALEALVGRPPRSDLEREGAAALGAAMFGHSLAQRKLGKRGLSLYEVLGAAIGVAEGGGGLRRVLEQNTRLPADKVLGIPARADVPVRLAVLQGHAARAVDNEYLGLLAATTDRDGELELRFSVSGDGRLALSAVSPTGRPVPVTFERSAVDATTLAHSLSTAVLETPASGPPVREGLLGGLRRALFGG